MRALGFIGLMGVFIAGGTAWGGQLASTVDVFRSGDSRNRHPTRWEGVLQVPGNVDPGGSLVLNYWRDGNRGTDRGSVLYSLEIRRDTTADGVLDSVTQHEIEGSREDRAISVTLGPLDDLREGDEVAVAARFRRMPRLERGDRATLELALFDSERRCPEIPQPVGGITPPRRISFPSPQYTEEARLARIQGTVIIQSVLACDGRPRDLRVLKGLPLGLDSAAVEALSQWRLEPARRGRVPITVFYNLTVNFRLQSVRSRGAGPETTVTGRVVGLANR